MYRARQATDKAGQGRTGHDKARQGKGSAVGMTLVSGKSAAMANLQWAVLVGMASDGGSSGAVGGC